MATELVAQVEVNWGKWVARCPRPYCPGVETIGRCDDGSEGGLTGERFTCRTSHGGCGLIADAVWPAHIDSIEALLAARPVPATRNWQPVQSLVDLIAENLEYGVPVPDGVTGLIITAAEQRRPIGA